MSDEVTKFILLPLGEVGRLLRYLMQDQRHYRAIIAQKPEAYRLILNYETFYGGDVTTNRQALAQVFRWLGVDMPDLDGFNAHVDPKVARINSVETYRLLPNAEAIDRRYGSAATGRLFAA